MKVREWIDFMGKEENVVIGLQKNDGFICPSNRYFTADQAKERFKKWLEEEVIDAHPFYFVENGEQYCLLIY